MRTNISKNKKGSINLNIYRNLHHHSLSYQKIAFHNAVKPLLKNLPKLKCISIHYSICPKSKRRLDIMNIGSIVDKYFSDTLVECGIIPDDDYHHILHVSFGFGGLMDSECVIATISELNVNQQEKQQKMRVFLDQHEIEEALNAYIESKGIPDSTGVNLSVDEDNNVIAEVMIGDSESFEETNAPLTISDTNTQSQPKKRRGRKPNALKNKENVGETNQSGASGNNTGSSQAADDRITSDIPQPSSEGRTSKNLFEDTDEGSSNNQTSSKSSDSENVAPVPKTKKSIFDDE